jgi:hypothetical protein
MIHVNIFFADVGPLPQWLNFLIMAGSILIAAFGAFAGVMLFRKKRKRKRKRHHRGKSQINQTLAQTTGLPPKKENPGETSQP